MAATELMKSIVKKTGEFEDEIIYLHLFNKLTNSGKIKNYSHNSNGIFFDLTKIKVGLLEEILEELVNYKHTKEEAKKEDLNREQLVSDLKKEVSKLDSQTGSPKEKGKIQVKPNEIASFPESDSECSEIERNIFEEPEIFDEESICSNDLFGECSE
jgi:hypothetical protein